MDVSLDDIDGVGSGTAKKLREADFETVEAVASATTDELEDVKGFGPERASDISTAASDLLAESIDATSPNEELDTAPVSYDVPYEISFFLLNGLTKEAIRLHARNQLSQRNRAFRICGSLMEQFASKATDIEPDESFTFEFDATMDDLNILSRALSTEVSDLQSMSGITSAHSKLGAIRSSVRDDRDEHWGM
jgi:hypothetical protein